MTVEELCKKLTEFKADEVIMIWNDKQGRGCSIHLENIIGSDEEVVEFVINKK